MSAHNRLMLFVAQQHNEPRRGDRSYHELAASRSRLKDCEHCERLFIARRIDAKYCSAACGPATRRFAKQATK